MLCRGFFHFEIFFFLQDTYFTLMLFCFGFFKEVINRESTFEYRLLIMNWGKFAQSAESDTRIWVCICNLRIINYVLNYKMTYIWHRDRSAASFPFQLGWLLRKYKHRTSGGQFVEEPNFDWWRSLRQMYCDVTESPGNKVPKA